MTGKEHFERFATELQGLDDSELIQLFNNEVGGQGWGSTRASFLAALHNEFNQRSFDYSSIGDKNSLSFKHKIELIDKKILILS